MKARRKRPQPKTAPAKSIEKRPNCYDELTENYDLDEPEVRAWALEYCRYFEDCGIEFEFDESRCIPEEGMLRFWLEFGPYCDTGFPELEYFTAPALPTSPHFVIEFEEPGRWWGATFGVDLLDFRFSAFLLASDNDDLAFFVRPRPAKRLSMKAHKKICDAVVSGLEYDFEYGEDYGVCCLPKSTELFVTVRSPSGAADEAWMNDYGELNGTGPFTSRDPGRDVSSMPRGN